MKRIPLLVTLASLTACACALPPPSAVPEVGSIAPDFKLAAQDGERLRLSDLAARGPVVLVFYRGHW